MELTIHLKFAVLFFVLITLVWHVRVTQYTTVCLDVILYVHAHVLQIFAINFVTFAINFVLFAIEFVTFAVKFVTFVIEFVALTIEFDVLAVELGTIIALACLQEISS